MKFGEKFDKFDKSYPAEFYEYDLIGKVDTEHPDYQSELKRYQDLARKSGHKFKGDNNMPVEYAIELARKFQPDKDPAHPKKEFARDIRISVGDFLGLKTDEELERLRFFTCAGREKSPADFHHGIDFFLSFIADDGKEYIVTGDVTRHPEKIKKADFLVEEDVPDPSDDDYDSKKYCDIVENYGKISFEILNNKIKEKKYWEPKI
ncbi:MAG: hypothetical protein A2Y98_02245 [Candidatus Portnoybacteria bacterium RBG_19FT_COMBO_36_7]|uniref:Uncharacterized protein n=1 Tax=Candidatus Portnoybacteria bacterium RBG_19FT_COMBO_36_7 TaxID=1801992 RepID=A0A1G2F8Q0_9BACT|nr:MAG: hypothetical protein A2Y98_02245 [Candidatus Portnoybacteria bacterium RBG_19FT_COMBO_36_7]